MILNCNLFDFYDSTLQSVASINQSSNNCIIRLAWEPSLDWHGNRRSTGMGIVARLAWESSLDWHGNRRSIGVESVIRFKQLKKN
jgi:hypothetical protein